MQYYCPRSSRNEEAGRGENTFPSKQTEQIVPERVDLTEDIQENLDVVAESFPAKEKLTPGRSTFEGGGDVVK